MKIWECKIGEVDGVPRATDVPMRAAIEEAYIRITGEKPNFCFSGWTGELSEGERSVIENRLPITNPLANETDVKKLQKTVEFLWDLLDNIDTIDDMARENNTVFRYAVNKIQKKRHQVATSLDGQTLVMI